MTGPCAQRTDRVVSRRRTLALVSPSPQFLSYLLGILLLLQLGHDVAAVEEQAASASSFRVTGVVAAGEDDWMVLLEAEDGTYQRIRVGDALAGGQVLAIGPRWMRIGFGGREEVWRLEVPEAPKRAATGGSDAMPEPAEGFGPMRLLKPAALQALKIEAAQLRQMSRGGTSTPQDTARQLFDLLDPLLDFKMPAGGAVVAVNDQPPASLSTAVDAIVQGLEQGGPVNLKVRNQAADPQEAAGLERFYLVPNSQNTQDTQ